MGWPSCAASTSAAARGSCASIAMNGAATEASNDAGRLLLAELAPLLAVRHDPVEADAAEASSRPRQHPSATVWPLPVFASVAVIV